MLAVLGPFCLFMVIYGDLALRTIYGAKFGGNGEVVALLAVGSSSTWPLSRWRLPSSSRPPGGGFPLPFRGLARNRNGGPAACPLLRAGWGRGGHDAAGATASCTAGRSTGRRCGLRSQERRDDTNRDPEGSRAQFGAFSSPCSWPPPSSESSMGRISRSRRDLGPRDLRRSKSDRYRKRPPAGNDPFARPAGNRRLLCAGGPRESTAVPRRGLFRSS